MHGSHADIILNIHGSLEPEPSSLIDTGTVYAASGAEVQFYKTIFQITALHTVKQFS